MSDKKLLIKAVIFGAVSALLFSIILLCICSAIMLTTGLLPADVTNYVMLAVVFAGTFCGGFITSRITKSAGLIVGLITGFAVFIIITISGFIKSNETFTLITLLRFILTIVAGAVGGALGVNKKDKIHIK